MEKLRLVIADDEKIIRDTLAKMVDWEKYNIEVVAVCKNGLEAYDAVVDEYPDFVLTDICMPGLSGLQLIEKLNQTYDDISFIILSGYDEFSYAKKAVELGVKGYLLKPCNEEEIIETICEVQKKNNSFNQRKRNSVMNSNLLRNFITEAVVSTEPVEKVVSLYKKNYEFTGKRYQITYCFFLEKTQVNEYVQKIWEYNPSAVKSDYLILYVKNILLVLSEERFDFSMPPFPSNEQIEEKRENFENLEEAAYHIIPKLRRYDIIYMVDENRSIPIYNYESCREKISELYEQYCNGKLDREAFRKSFLEEISNLQHTEFLYVVLTSIFMDAPDGDEKSIVFSTDFIQKMKNAPDYENMADMVDEMFDQIFPVTQILDYKPYIDKLIQYTHHHIADPNLTLKWIAENYLFMNVDYVSKQFLKDTGEKYSNYLNRFRIQRAKEIMMEDRTKKVNQVADEVGCGNNPCYFSYLFKKYEGVTPTEFSENIK